jgi:Xaa-Pro aminopeptidase
VPDCRSNFQGDEALAGLLAKQQIGKSVEEVRAILEGVNAAVLDAQDESWLALIARDPTPALAAQLRALKADLAARAKSAEQPSLANRLTALRHELFARNLQGFLIPRADEHQGEYVPPCAQRLAWLTGFTGSAGLAIVLADWAAIFVDGRYTIQVRAEVDAKLFEPFNSGDTQPADWLGSVAKKGDRIGLDPWLHTRDQIERYRSALARAGAVLVELDSNPLDAIWPARPPQPLGPVRVQPAEFAGRASPDKIQAIAAELKSQKVDATVLAAPDSIAWLLNVRGSDVEHTPLPLSYAVVRAEGTVDWFVDERKLLPDVPRALGNSVAIVQPHGFIAALGKLGKAKARVLIDTAATSGAIPSILEQAGATLAPGADPCLLPKAVKNPVELDGTRAAHHRDGVALARFLAWFAQASPSGGLREIQVSDKLEEFRRLGDHFRDLSFSTISGAGPNGAIVHYRASEATERTLNPGELFLLDSGAQYFDGTTDVTRTLAVGTPNAEQRDRFTRVLKGHIALALARFPAGTTGSQLDALARRPLWEAGLDYDHGTGHGVGSYLSVHEGPQRIAKMGNTVALKPGMILSNEPGYYKTGAYGIRIENLVIVTPIDVPGAEREMLGFETLTLAPIDRALIDTALLTETERAWLNRYHQRVADEIVPKLSSEERRWLAEVTQPI